MAGDHGSWGRNGGRQVIPTRSFFGDWDEPLLTVVQPLPDCPPDIRRTEKLSAAVGELVDTVDELRESQKLLEASVVGWQAELHSAREEIRVLRQALEAGKSWWSDLLSPVTLVGVLLIVLTIGPMLPAPFHSSNNAVTPPVSVPIVNPQPVATAAAPVQVLPPPAVVVHRSSHPSRPRAKTGRSRGAQR